MGITSLYLGIGSLASSLTFLRPSVIESLDIFSCQAMVGRLCPTTFRGTSLGCYASGRPLNLVRCLLRDVLFLHLFLFDLVVLLTLCILLFCSERSS